MGLDEVCNFLQQMMEIVRFSFLIWLWYCHLLVIVSLLILSAFRIIIFINVGFPQACLH